MNRDPRGGHNRKEINENFFKTWSPNMAYVLGLIMADGAVEDTRKSSRTCYLQFTSKDLSLIKQVRKVLSSTHNINMVSNKIVKIGNTKSYISTGPIYNLRIGSKSLFQDLINLGVTPRKSLRLKLPPAPDRYFNFLLRGYFDGDGCVNIYKPKNRTNFRVTAIFTSGCKEFLENLSEKTSNLLDIKRMKVYFNTGAFRLAYRESLAIRVLNYIYKNLNKSPYLERKYKIYLQALA